MFKKVFFIGCMLLALFVLVPILNQIILNWTEPGGILDETFNETNAAAWNETGTILTSNQTSMIGLTGLEEAVTQGYVWLFVLFFGGIIFYVVGKTWFARRGGGQQ